MDVDVIALKLRMNADSAVLTIKWDERLKAEATAAERRALQKQLRAVRRELEPVPERNGSLGFELPRVPKGVSTPAVILLLSDGANTNGPTPLDAIPQAADRGIRVYTIGPGSPDASRPGTAMRQRAPLDEDTRTNGGIDRGRILSRLQRRRFE